MKDILLFQCNKKHIEIVGERLDRLIFSIYITKVSIKFELSTFATFYPIVQSIRIRYIANTVGNYVELSRSFSH